MYLNERGMLPSRSLEFKYSSLSCDRLPSDGGTGPVSLQQTTIRDTIICYIRAASTLPLQNHEDKRK
jgi:hypothetical protein